jgi:hypothetical protein
MNQNTPTIDPGKINVGDVFYHVEKCFFDSNNPRIYKEFEGEVWYRYEKPRENFEITTYTVLGVLTKNVEGSWPDHMSDELGLELYVVDQNEETQTIEDYWFDQGAFFLDKDDALVYKNLKIEEALASDLAHRRKV